MSLLNRKTVSAIWLTLVLVAILLCDVPVIKGANPRSHCSETLPSSLNQLIKERYLDFQVLNKKDSTHGCPGIAKVDFYGDGRTVYAVVIRKPHKSEAVVEGKLLLAEKEDKHWKVTLLDEGDDWGSVSHEPAGEYGDMYRTRSIKSKGDLIVYFRYDQSWAVGFGWTGDKIEEVQLTD